jgi:hypothetical protein
MICQLLLRWLSRELSCGTARLRWLDVTVLCGIGWVRWPYYGLPRGTVMGSTCQVTCAGVGPTLVMWSNRGLTCGKLGLRLLHTVLPCVSWGSNSLLMCVDVTVSCGIG